MDITYTDFAIFDRLIERYDVHLYDCDGTVLKVFKVDPYGIVDERGNYSNWMFTFKDDLAFNERAVMTVSSKDYEDPEWVPM